MDTSGKWVYETMLLLTTMVSRGLGDLERDNTFGLLDRSYLCLQISFTWACSPSEEAWGRGKYRRQICLPLLPHSPYTPDTLKVEKGLV